jgi:hypothetical protein
MCQFGMNSKKFNLRNKTKNLEKKLHGYSLAHLPFYFKYLFVYLSKQIVGCIFFLAK